MEIVMNLSEQQSEEPPIEINLCKERLGEIKNQLLDSVKQCWISPGRRDSIGSQASINSKRDREDDLASDRTNRPRISTSQTQ